MLRHVAAATLCLSFVIGTAQAADVPAYVNAAVANSSRPEADTARDSDRKPAEVVAFSGLKPGDKIADLNPGGGFYTRIFAKVVGAQGKVYGLVPKSSLERRPEAGDAIKAIAEHSSNVMFHPVSITAIETPEPLDMVWTSNNYHDFKNRDAGVTDVMNKSVFNALRPGGIYIVTDHAAAAGSGGRDTNTLHRVDPALVKQEVIAAGFVLDGESDVLHSAADDHTSKVFEKGMRGHTDRFVLRFRKPS
jgi:predicted methyltransferase